MSPETPYHAPDARLADAPVRMDVPEQITGPIKHGWVAATISGLFTLIGAVWLMFTGPAGMSAGLLTLIDVALIAVFAFGIYRRSRVASTAMLLYFLLGKGLIMWKAGAPDGIVLGLVFVFFYFHAMVGTWRYQRFVKEWKRNPPAPKPRLSDDPFFRHSGPVAVEHPPAT